jgi:hypothetical protein
MSDARLTDEALAARAEEARGGAVCDFSRF